LWSTFIGFNPCEEGGFEFKAPTSRKNALRVLRAMQLPKPGMFIYILLSLYSVIYCIWYHGTGLWQMQGKAAHNRPKSTMCLTLLSGLHCK
jgi:hypothetical protein